MTENDGFTKEEKEKLQVLADQLFIQEEFYEKNGRDCTEILKDEIMAGIALSYKPGMDIKEIVVKSPSETNAQRIRVLDSFLRKINAFIEKKDHAGLLTFLEGSYLSLFQDGVKFYEGVAVPDDIPYSDLGPVYKDEPCSNEEIMQRMKAAGKKTRELVQEERDYLWRDDRSSARMTSFHQFWWEGAFEEYLDYVIKMQ